MCLHVALWTFWTDWHLRKLSSAHKTSTPGVQVWAKPLGQGKTAALFINGGSAEYTASLSLQELNITGASAKVKVTDV